MLEDEEFTVLRREFSVADRFFTNWRNQFYYYSADDLHMNSFWFV